MKHHFKQHCGFTLVEAMVVVALLSFLVAATYGTFLSGQNIWNRTSTTIDLDEQLTKATNRMTAELRQSGHDAKGKFQIHISSQTGINESDVFKFSIPVICETGGNPVDANGDTAHWGAPLTWGCSLASCMDGNNNCETIEYKYVQYLVNDKHQLMRRVLDFSENMTKEEIIAENIARIRLEPNFDERLVKLTISAQKEVSKKRTVTQDAQINIQLRNAK